MRVLRLKNTLKLTFVSDNEDVNGINKSEVNGLKK